MSLNAGTNTIRFTTSPSAGEVYYDRLDVTAPAGAASDTVTYLFANSQGTVALASDHATVAASTVVRNRYSPFGANRAADAIGQSEHGWIGQVEDPGGLSYLNARYYDPALGRFLSVDPITDPYQPQMLNGYTYAFNNPTTLTDKSGLKPKKTASVPCGSATRSASRAHR